MQGGAPGHLCYGTRRWRVEKRVWQDDSQQATAAVTAVSQARIGAAVGCCVVRVVLCIPEFRGIVGDQRCGEPQTHSSNMQVEKVDLFGGMRGLDWSIEKWHRIHIFRLHKKAQFCLRPEISLFDPQIGQHKHCLYSAKLTRAKRTKAKLVGLGLREAPRREKTEVLPGDPADGAAGGKIKATCLHCTHKNIL